MRKYCLDLDLSFIGFPVLTPLPGTDLYHDMKDKLITSDYDYFDFFHSLLPTTLPLKDFYRELTMLYKKSRSFRNRIKLMSRYPILEWPSLLKAYGEFMKRFGSSAGGRGGSEWHNDDARRSWW